MIEYYLMVTFYIEKIRVKNQDSYKSMQIAQPELVWYSLQRSFSFRYVIRSEIK